MSEEEISHEVNEQDKIDQYVRMAKPTVSVIGLGGAGSNVITWMKEKGVQGAKIIAMNTDAAHLSMTKADNRLLLGEKLCRGSGCGGYSERGAEATKESMDDVTRELAGSNLVFLTAGLGGGTGTGASWVLANALKEAGVLTIGVVTIPFAVESSRMDRARDGLQRLRNECDTVVVIDNDKLRQVAGNLPIKQAFAVANELIGTFVKHVTETVTTPSLVNLDFADLKAIMERGGVSAIGVGESDGQDRVDRAVKMAIDTQLLDIDDMNAATGALVNVIGGEDLTLEEVTRTGEIISKSLPSKAKMIWGAGIDEALTGQVRVLVTLTGVDCKFLHPGVDKLEVMMNPPPPPEPEPEPEPAKKKKRGFFSF
jgi:cell division protein FtsZ